MAEHRHPHPRDHNLDLIHEHAAKSGAHSHKGFGPAAPVEVPVVNIDESQENADWLKSPAGLRASLPPGTDVVAYLEANGGTDLPIYKRAVAERDAAG